MNPKDMARLQYKNIRDNYIVFDRAKTTTTVREDAKSINVYFTEDLSKIIQRWGNKKEDNNTYIFPILKEGMNPLEEMFAVQNFTKTTNKWMKKIFKELGYNVGSTTIVARHSFSTHIF